METFRVGIDFRGAQSGGGSGQRGIGRYTTDLVAGLLDYGPDIVREKLGKELQVVLFHTAGVSIPASLSGRVEAAPVDAPRWDSPRKPLWMRIPKLRSIPALHQWHLERTIAAQERAISAQILSGKLDIVHLPTALDVGSYPQVNAPCPVVMTVLDTIILSLPELGIDRYPRHLRWYYRNQMLNLSKADRLVAISQATKDDVVRQIGIPNESIDVVYPAVSLAFAEECPPPDLPEIAGHNYYLFCSVPDPHKNPFAVIEAFASISGQDRLVFVAPNDHPETQKCIRLANDLGVGARFVVTGFVDEPMLRVLFKHAIALVSPSQMEGFGLPVAQAMRSGIPVITSNRSAQAEIADGVGILVDPSDTKEIALAMEKVKGKAYDPSAGFQRAEEFDPEVVTRALLESYSRALRNA